MTAFGVDPNFIPNRDAIEYSKRVEPGYYVTFTGTDEVWIILTSDLKRMMPDGRLSWFVLALSSWDDPGCPMQRQLEINKGHWKLSKKEWK